MSIEISKFKIVQIESPSENDVALISSKLFEYNQQQRGADYKVVAAFAKSIDNEIVAGITGMHRWGWAHIDVLWVSESFRKMGIGTKLIELAEKLFCDANCRIIDLHTFSFQAPEFYCQHGYKIMFELDIDEQGTKQIFLRKPLR